MIPSLNLGKLNGDGPPVPSLNLGAPSAAPENNAPPEVPQLGFKNLSSANQGVSFPGLDFSNIKKDQPQAPPPLNFGSKNQSSIGIPGLGINLGQLPPASCKSDIQQIYICLPYREFAGEKQFSEFQNSYQEQFGNEAKIEQISKNPNQWVVVRPENISESVIPTIDEIDRAYQESEHLPANIEQVNCESVLLTRQIEMSSSENELMKSQKEQLKVEIAVLREKLARVQEESQMFSNSAKKIKQDFDSMMNKVGPIHE